MILSRWQLVSTLRHSACNTHRRWITNSVNRRKNRLNEEIIPLDIFILNNQIKTLYRTIVRAIIKLPQDQSFKKELYQYTKEEFDVHKNVTDKHNRMYLLSQGRKQFKDMARSIGLMVPDHVVEE